MRIIVMFTLYYGPDEMRLNKPASKLYSVLFMSALSRFAPGNNDLLFQLLVFSGQAGGAVTVSVLPTEHRPSDHHSDES